MNDGTRHNIFRFWLSFAHKLLICLSKVNLLLIRTIKNRFFVLLTTLVNDSTHTNCVSLSYQKCEIPPNPINVHPNEYSQELHYYLFAFELDRFVGSCNSLNDLSNEVCVPNKIGHLNIHIFNMLRGMNELKMLTKHISYECKCKFDGKKCNSNQKCNNDKCRCECRKPKIIVCAKKNYIWNPATVVVKMVNIQQVLSIQ